MSEQKKKNTSRQHFSIRQGLPNIELKMLYPKAAILREKGNKNLIYEGAAVMLYTRVVWQRPQIEIRNEEL